MTWTKSPYGENLFSRAIIDTHEAATRLEIEKADKYDAGKYTVAVENPSGRKEATISVKVYGELIQLSITLRSNIKYSIEV